MEVFHLGIRFDGEGILEEIHATQEGAETGLQGFVEENWDAELMGRNFDSVSAKEVTKLFFDVMEEYHYSIYPFEVKGEVPIPALVDPFPNMEPVPLEDLELRIIQCCLKMVAPNTIRQYVHKYFRLDYDTDHVQKVQAAVIAKMD